MSEQKPLCRACGRTLSRYEMEEGLVCDHCWNDAHRKPAPQEPSADTLQAVRALYRDDLDAMAQAIIDLRADLAEATRGDAEPSRCVWAKTPSGLHAPSCLGGEQVNYTQSEMSQWSACHYCGRPIQTATPPTCGYCRQVYGFDFQTRRVICGCTSTTNQEK